MKTVDEIAQMQATLFTPEVREAQQFLASCARGAGAENPLAQVVEHFRSKAARIEGRLTNIPLLMKMGVPLADTEMSLADEMQRAIAAISAPLEQVQAQADTLFPQEKQEQGSKAAQAMQDFLGRMQAEQVQLSAAPSSPASPGTSR